MADDFYTRRNSLRLSGFDYTSRRSAFVTIVTDKRRRHFLNPHIAAATISALDELRNACQFLVYSYCLMPDHFHMLLGTGDSGLSIGAICGRFKSLSTRDFWKYEDGKLWQRQFFDHVIRNTEDFWETVDYIRMNPVEAGLASTWDEWPYYGEPDLKNY